MPLVLLVSLVAAACGGSTVVTQELGGRSDGQANPPTDTTTTSEAPTTTAETPVVSDGPVTAIEDAMNGFFEAMIDADISAAYSLMAPQHRDLCTLEDAQAIGGEPTNENVLFEVVDYEEVSGGAIVDFVDLVGNSEYSGVGMVLFAGDWYVDAPLCLVLETQLASTQDSAAKSNLRNSLATEKAYYSVNQAFTDDVVTLSAIEPNLFNTGNDPVTPSLSLQGNLCLETVSDSGAYWAIWDGTNAGTQYGWNTSPMFASGCPDFIDSSVAGQWSTAGW